MKIAIILGVIIGGGLGGLAAIRYSVPIPVFQGQQVSFPAAEWFKLLAAMITQALAVMYMFHRTILGIGERLIKIEIELKHCVERANRHSDTLEDILRVQKQRKVR